MLLARLYAAMKPTLCRHRAFEINVLEKETLYWNGFRHFFYPVGQHFRQFQVETLKGQFLFSERFGANSAEIIAGPAVPAVAGGDSLPCYIGSEIAVHTLPVRCVLAVWEGQMVLSESDDGLIFVFHVVQPRQIVVATPGAMSVTRERRAFLLSARRLRT
jgi:hypothetical protein